MKRYKKQRDIIELILNFIKGLYINMRYHFEINQFSIILPFLMDTLISDEDNLYNNIIFEELATLFKHTLSGFFNKQRS